MSQAWQDALTKACSSMLLPALLLSIAFQGLTGASAPDIYAQRRPAITAAARLEDVFPGGLDGNLINNIIGRQASSTCGVATDTPCADGSGCCPYGSECTTTIANGATFGICAAPCQYGAAVCTVGDFTACCPDLGLTCRSDGQCATPPAGISPTNVYTTSVPHLSLPSLGPASIPVVSFPTTDPGLRSVLASQAASESAFDASISRQESSASAAESLADASYSAARASISASESLAEASRSASLAAFFSSQSAQASQARATQLNPSGGSSGSVVSVALPLLISMPLAIAVLAVAL